MKYNSIEEWLAMGEELFGDDRRDWAFVCPACGKISIGREFEAAGATPNDIYNTCIGRHNGKGISGASSKGDTSPEFGCDWAAYGLLGTLGKGDVVVDENGREIHVFKFAAPNAQEG